MSLSHAWWRPAIVVLLTWLALAATPAHAEVEAPDSPLPLDAAELAAWADREFGSALAARRFSALALIIVSGDKVILDRTYGHADWASRTPLDSGSTEFLIGSITKTFTATAIAQLLERGQIASLDDPVNRYLKRFKLPPPHGDSVTFWHVLTHSAGFELRNAGLASLEPQRRPLEPEVLNRVMTDIVHPPGKYPSYANFGTGLLGVLIEDVTGQPVDAYFREHLFTPLGMLHTRMNVGPERPAALVRVYRRESGLAPVELPWLPFSAYAGPIGGISTTPRDMVQYMKAHLQTGEFRSRNILQSATLEKMHAPRFGVHPAANQFGMQFFTSRWNGRRLVEHGGNWPYNVSMMTLLPDQQLGFFVATVGDSAADARFLPAWEVRARLMTHLFGAQSWEQQPGADMALEHYVGNYQRIQRNHSTLEAFLDLVSASAGPADSNAFVTAVARDGRGGLRIGGVDGYLPIGGDRFWKKDFTPGPAWSGPLVTFTRDSSGRVAGLTDYFGIDTSPRVSGLANLGTRGRLAQLCALVLLTGIGAVFWRSRERLGHTARWLAVLGALAVVAMPLVLFGFHDVGGFGYYLLAAQTGRWWAFALLANFLVVVTAGLAWANLRAWQTPASGWREQLARWHGAVLVLSGAALAMILHSVNALGFHLP